MSTKGQLLGRQIHTLAPYARRHGDEWHGDVVMARYLSHAGVRTLIAVPHLVQHGDLPSLSGNDFHGLRRGVSGP
ncbi:hypothetical protein AB0L49_48300 [Streptomyces antimycoticus]|uniref:hypothetical protein n=1 Tax=Streptomyces antimycoticus TaxID=68175 RepID=UPI003436E8B2